MRGGIRQFDYNHKLVKLVSTHPLGDFICVRCKTERFEVGTKSVARRNALKLAQKDNHIGSNACGYESNDVVTMNAGVGINGQRNTY